MALHEAIENGADEALLLDKNGYISEGSGENIFLVKNNKITTPKTDHCLNGITRQSVIEIARDFGFLVEEKNITKHRGHVGDAGHIPLRQVLIE